MGYRRRIVSNLNSPLVTIVIPARNEEANIADLLESLLLQNYPQNSYEILVVNDRSTDKTEAILSEYTQKDSRIRYITIQETNEALTGKQNALDVGIRAAKGEIVLLTDADCIIPREWIKTNVELFNTSDVGLVVGKTEIYQPKRFRDRFQVLFHRINIEIAQVSIMVGGYTSGMGNNLAIKKSAYEAIGGYPQLGKSILDDEILVRGVAKAGYHLRANIDPEGIVYTKPMSDWKSIEKQHIRWIDGGLHYKSPTRFWLIACFLFNSFLLYLLIYGIIMRDIYALGCVLVRYASDYMFFALLNQRHHPRQVKWYEDFIFAVIMHYYVHYLTVRSLFFTKKIEWKSDQIRRGEL